jgi:transketolase
MRRQLAMSLIEHARNDSTIFFITGDLGFQVFDNFKHEFPDRYLNVGISEAGMISIATGLASEGFTPIVYSIASFLLPKTYEQVKLLSIYNENRIILIGAGGGLAYSMSGPSHHSLDDLSLALLIPNLDVHAPSGPDSLKSVLGQSLKSKTTSYIQIGKFGEPNYPKEAGLIDSDIGLITTGVIANDVYGLSVELIKMGYNLHLKIVESLRPFSKENFLKFISNKKKLIVIEESWGKLSLYSLILDLLYENKVQIDLFRIGPDHEIMSENLERSRRIFDFGLNAEVLIKIIGIK